MLVSSNAIHRSFIYAALTAAFTLTTADLVHAQSGGGQRYAPRQQPVQRAPAAGSGQRQQPQSQGSGAQSAQGSGSQSAQAAKTALGGYCSVCLVEKRAWNQGNANFASVYDGRRYLFPGAKQKSMFDANPTKYTPVLAGDDVVAYAQSGNRLPGVLENGISYKGRYYFFASAANKQAFQASPERYSNVDLALGGDCIVCQLDMNKTMAGNPEFTSLHNGLRYQFPHAGAQQAFLANPVKYAQTVSSPGSSSRQPAPRGSGGGSGSY